MAACSRGGAFGWTSALNADYPIFRAGAGKANVRLTEAQRQAAVATYQKTIQTAFREVADALARRGTMNERLRALEAQQEAAADNYRLFDARYRGGIDDFLTSLVAQRAYYLAQQQLVLSKLIAGTNLVDLYDFAWRRLALSAEQCGGRPTSIGRGNTAGPSSNVADHSRSKQAVATGVALLINLRDRPRAATLEAWGDPAPTIPQWSFVT